MSERWYVYILRCGDGTLYTGITNDLARRLAQHAAGTGAKYTRGRGPLTLEARRRFPSRSDASRVEAWIKKARPADKLRRLRQVGRTRPAP